MLFHRLCNAGVARDLLCLIPHREMEPGMDRDHIRGGFGERAPQNCSGFLSGLSRTLAIEMAGIPEIGRGQTSKTLSAEPA